MTREEAKQIISDIDKAYRNFTADEYKALEMAIKALSQEPCTDAVSRKAVDEIKELMTDINGDTVYAVRMSDIRQLPSVTQKSVIEDIKAEIEQSRYGLVNDGLDIALKIIDKYTK